jgi:ATP-binding cassette, subfamily B, bacterial
VNARLNTFVSYYRPYRRLLLADIVSAVLAAAITLALPLCVSYITQNVLGNPTPDAPTHILSMGALMLGLVLVQAACLYFVDYQGHMMGSLMERDMRDDLFAHYQKLSFGFYDEEKTGQLMSRLTNDLMAISELAHHGPEESIIAVLKFVGAFFILLTINVPLTLVIFAVLLIMVVWAVVVNQRMNTAEYRSRERISDVNAQVEDTLAGIRVVKSFANEALEQVKFSAANQRFVESRREVYKGWGSFTAGMNIFTQLITVGVVVFGGIAILNASLTLADLITYLLFAGILIDPIKLFVNLGRLFQEGITGFNRFVEIMEIAPDIQDAPDATELPPVKGHIQFRDVHFRYRAEHEDVLRQVNLEVAAGEYVALVGSSGAGKTTLCSLIPRFYEVSAGQILLDGHDIRSVRLRSLREQIGVVQQDVYLFNGTVAENIAYGKAGASREAIIAAAKQANAHNFIMHLPQGYDTDIGQRGVKLSGGQKQRLSIARVFLKNPPILIFDEATSALDNETEKAVRESLEALAHNRTMLVIAHRLTTIRNAQRIVVLTENGIEEQGTHESLLARDGVYAHLYDTQATL